MTDTITITGMAEAIDDFDGYANREQGMHTELMLDRDTGEVWSDHFIGESWNEYRDEAVMYLSRHMLQDSEYVTREEAVDAILADDPDAEIPDILEDDGNRPVITEQTATAAAIEACKAWQEAGLSQN